MSTELTTQSDKPTQADPSEKNAHGTNNETKIGYDWHELYSSILYCNIYFVLRIFLLLVSLMLLFLCIIYGIGQITKLDLANYFCQTNSLDSIYKHSQNYNLTNGTSDECFVSKGLIVDNDLLFSAQAYQATSDFLTINIVKFVLFCIGSLWFTYCFAWYFGTLIIDWFWRFPHKYYHPRYFFAYIFFSFFFFLFLQRFFFLCCDFFILSFQRKSVFDNQQHSYVLFHPNVRNSTSTINTQQPTLK